MGVTPPGHWYRRTLVLAGPIIVSNTSVPLVGAVDTAVVGHLPDPVYIGAVALGAAVFSLLFWGFGFLRMGTTGFTAQALGRGDREELRAVLARAALTALVLGVVLIALQWPLGVLSLALTGAEGLLREETLAYFRVRVWGAPATLLNYALLGYLIGVQRTGAALVHQLTLNLTNVALDLLLVFGLDQGVRGVAAASVAAELAAAVVGLRLIAARLPRPFATDATRVFERGRLLALLRVNVDIAVRTLCLIAAFFSFTLAGSRQGELVLAANAVLMHLQHFMAYGLDGFAHAAETLSGHAYGARRATDFSAAVRATSVLAVGVAAFYSLVYFLFGPHLVAVLTGIEAVREEALRFLPWLVAAPLISVWSFQLDGVFIGTTHTREMRNAMLLSLAVFAASVSVALPAFGNHGLWAALLVFMVARALTLAFYYPRIRRAAAAPVFPTEREIIPKASD